MGFSVVGCAERALCHVFIRLARVISRHPLPFIIIPIVITLGLLPGFIRFNYVYDTEYLYTPYNGIGKDNRRELSKLFPSNDTHRFINTRKVEEDGFLRIIITETTKHSNMFTNTGFDAMRRVNFAVKNFTSIEKSISFNDICTRWYGECTDNGLIILFAEETIESLPLNYPVHDVEHFLGNELGNVEVDENGHVQKAEAILLTYDVQILDEDTKELSTIWLDEVKDELLDLDVPGFELSLATTDSLNDELHKISEHIIPLFAIAYTLLCMFSMTTCMMFDWIRSKTMVATAGQVSTAMAIVSGMALLVTCGVPFASIVSTMPFLLMGIGIDNMFVMVGVWRETSIRRPVHERMEQTLSKAAVSITLTSLTDCLAFGVGAISPFRSVQFFCAYAAVACAFCYVYSITFLAACMVYSGRWEEDNRHTMTTKEIDPQTAAAKRGNCLYRMFCWGSAIYHGEVKSKSAVLASRNEQFDDSRIPDIIVPYITKLIEYPYANLLLKPPIKFLVVLSYLAYLALAVWGCMGLEEGLELQNLAPDNSYLADFYPKYDRIYGTQYSGRIMVTIRDSLNYTDPHDLKMIDDLVESYQADKIFSSDPELLEFWLYLYQSYLESYNLQTPTMVEFISHLQPFLDFEPLRRFQLDVQFNDDMTAITSSRFMIQAGGVDGAEGERDLVIRSRELAENSPLDCFAFFRAFVYWEQYVIIMRTTLTNLAIAIASVLVVAFLLVPSLNALIMVALSICSITVGVVGYMSWWDVNLDSVSMINLVMCIGFSVDFSAHICYHFSVAGKTPKIKSSNKNEKVKQPGNDNVSYVAKVPVNDFVNGGFSDISLEDGANIKASRDDLNYTHDYITNAEYVAQPELEDMTGNEKATHTLAQLGFPIIQGAASTILAVSVLAFSDDYIHRTFFKTILLVMVFGFYHAMVVIPVVLSSTDNAWRALRNVCCRSSK